MSADPSERVTLAREQTQHGEIALFRRGDVVELVVNGVFAMDSRETASEIALADAVPDLPDGAPGHVLVGGLGLGFTAARLLARGASRIDVVELAEPLVRWARDGVTPQLGAVASDPRVRLHVGDIGDWLPAHPGIWDAVLLDVDNGPQFLIHDHNERLYRSQFLRLLVRRLAPGGVLLVWCESPAPELWAALRELDADAREIRVPVEREGRRFDYALYLLTSRHYRPTAGPLET